MASAIFNSEPKKYGVAESTLMKSTQIGHHYNLVNETTDIENGSVCVIGDYIGPDKFKAEVPQKKDKVVLILTTPKIYEEYESSMQNESNFYNGKGETMRGYEVQDTDRFALSTEAFSSDATLEKGKYVVVDGTGFKLTTEDSKPNMAEYGFVGHIYEVVTSVYGEKKYRVFVDKNQAVYSAE